MVEPSLRGAEATSETPGVKPASLHSNIEQAIRDEMRSVRTLDALPSTLREDLRSICVSAKTLDMRAELLVIAIKKVWQEIPEARSFARPVEMDTMLSEVVTMALEEFYGASIVMRGRDD
jgi:hypothetical protein